MPSDAYRQSSLSSAYPPTELSLLGGGGAAGSQDGGGSSSQHAACSAGRWPGGCATGPHQAGCFSPSQLLSTESPTASEEDSVKPSRPRRWDMGGWLVERGEQLLQKL